MLEDPRRKRSPSVCTEVTDNIDRVLQKYVVRSITGEGSRTRLSADRRQEQEEVRGQDTALLIFFFFFVFIHSLLALTTLRYTATDAKAKKVEVTSRLLGHSNRRATYSRETENDHAHGQDDLAHTPPPSLFLLFENSLSLSKPRGPTERRRNDRRR